jgi:hypothetical protein
MRLGHLRVSMLIEVFFMVVSIPLALFVSKKGREGKKLKSVVFRRGESIWPLVIGAAFGALFWWLAFRFLPHY